jgi:fructose-1,6-bisphosphatase I
MEASRIAIPIGVTLDRFIRSNESQYPQSVGDFSQLLRDIALASKVVNREINKAGLIDIMGSSGSHNTGGDDQQKLDILADIRFSRALLKGGAACAIISEEADSMSILNINGKYIVAIDPLDGSSNIDVNVSIGTIFSVYKRLSNIGEPVTIEDCLQCGTEQVAAGYILYGSSTMLVFTTGQGVNGFTYEATLGEYLLSHPNIIIKPEANTYSINEGNSNSFVQEGIHDYLNECKVEQFAGRYIGSLVADIHRNLLKGGIYLYPATRNNPDGKLRIMFEANSLAFIVEQAGGKASDGIQRILEIVPTSIHQKTPLFIGSSEMVKKLEVALNKY